MKTLLTIAIALLLAYAVQAQIPNPVLNPKVQTPVMKEWWRVDGKGYGIKGSTWLENFYHGNGVLVISTPSGVQSWQLRFPGDTTNVFTWQGGDANIMTGDLNGDGQMDYVDGNGRVYIGNPNGEPPSMSDMITGKPALIADFNKDGFEDVFTINPAGQFVGDIGIFSFGSTNLSTVKHSTLSRNASFDTSWTLHGIGMAGSSLRVVCSASLQTNSTDGYKLFEVTFDGVTLEPTLTSLDSILKASNISSYFTTSTAVVCNLNKDLVLFNTESIGGSLWSLNLVAYDIGLTNITQIANIRYDSIIRLNSLQLKPKDTRYVLATRRYHFPLREYLLFPSGDISKPLMSFVNYSGDVRLLGSRGGDTTSLFCIAGHFYNGTDDEDNLIFLTPKDSVATLIESDSFGTYLLIQSPNPCVRGAQVRLKAHIPIGATFSIRFVDALGIGKQLIDPMISDKEDYFYDLGSQLAQMPIGKYWYVLTVNDRKVIESIVLE